MTNHLNLDVELRDGELIDEIALMADLMVAASESAAPLVQAQIDGILLGRRSSA